MSRPSDLWLRKRDQCWMTTLNGRQIKLSNDKAEARKLFHKLMAADSQPMASGVTVRRLLDTYLTKTAPAKSRDRVKVQTTYFRLFCQAFGHRRAESLKPYEVNDWLDALPHAGSTKALILTMLKAGFNWGNRQGYLHDMPLKGVTKRKFARRTRMLSKDELTGVLAACKPRWRDYFTVLHLTGMRPISEAASLTAGHLDRPKHRAIFHEYKTAEKTGRPRVVYFPAEAWGIIERLSEEHPQGVLFRNRDGKSICARNANEYLKDACKRAGVDPFPVYTLRHARATEALGQGISVDVLAALLGNSPAVLRSNYSHLLDDSMAGVLADAAQRAVG